MDVPSKPDNSEVAKWLRLIATGEEQEIRPPLSDIEKWLAYIAENGGGVAKGYFYEGNFYKDAEHTELIEPKEGRIYYDQTDGKLYLYNGTEYKPVGSGAEIGRFLSGWNCVTGLPLTNPDTLPYEYSAGDYYVVDAIATNDGTNYRPDGSEYDGTASTTEETLNVAVNDFYFFDGTEWLLLKNSAPAPVQYIDWEVGT